MPDKLLNLKEAAECLRLSENEVRKLVKDGRITAYHIGGIYLRFKEEDVFSLRGRYGGSAVASSPKQDVSDKNGHPGTALSGLRDFLYFNDFYLVSLAIVILLIYVILKSIA